MSIKKKTNHTVNCKYIYLSQYLKITTTQSTALEYIALKQIFTCYHFVS